MLNLRAADRLALGETHNRGSIAKVIILSLVGGNCKPQSQGLHRRRRNSPCGISEPELGNWRMRGGVGGYDREVVAGPFGTLWMESSMSRGEAKSHLSSARNKTWKCWDSDPLPAKPVLARLALTHPLLLSCRNTGVCPSDDNPTNPRQGLFFQHPRPLFGSRGLLPPANTPPAAWHLWGNSGSRADATQGASSRLPRRTEQ